ncbi:MAG: FAD-dependent oxidoreductase [Chloroflexota bacterium]
MHVLIIGAGYAGTLAALRLAGKTGKAKITLVNAAPNFVERIRLHELAAGKTPRRHDLADLTRGKNISFVQGRVTAIDPTRREVMVQTPQSTETLTYDKLVYALGSYPDLDAVPGVREHAFSLNGVEAARQLQAKLAENPHARILICGGGLTGIELASEIAESHPNVSLTLLSRDPLGPNLSQKGRAYLLKQFARQKVNVREGVTVARVLANGVQTREDEHIPADLTIWVGSLTVPPLAREAGLAVNRIGQISVDATLRSTSHPDVFAVGDAAASGLRMSCNTAMPQGAHAADNLAALANGQPLQPFRFSFAGRCISLGRRVALMQLVDADDSPREQIVTGRLGALIKEMICRYTVDSLSWTRWLPNAYWWTKPAEAKAAPERSAQRA